MKDEQTRINERIKARRVTLIGSDGKKLGEFLKYDAVDMAKEEGLDLVQVSPDKETPVCKIMDYGKWKYDQKKKKKKQGQVANPKTKEIKLKLGIDTHDMNVKISQARKFLSKGDKVKVTVGYKGRQGAHLNLVREQCLEFYSLIEDDAELEVEPKLQGRFFIMVLRKKSDSS